MNHKEVAAAYHKKGCNCCQAVVLAFADELNLDKEAVQKISEAFGAGMGSMNSTCGALSGALMLAGIKNSDGNIDEPKTKGSTYKIARSLESRFKEAAGSTICREIKGVDTGEVLLSCPACIELGVELAEKELGL